MKSSRYIHPLMAFFFSCFSLITTAIYADQPWYYYYRLAVQSVEQKQWERAIDNLQRSISMRPEPSNNARTTGLFTIKYFPYFYLALCYYNLGRYEEAREQLEISFRYGAIRENNRVFTEATLLKQSIANKLRSIQQPPPQKTPEEPPLSTTQSSPEEPPPSTTQPPSVEPPLRQDNPPVPPPITTPPTRIEPEPFPDDIIKTALDFIKKSDFQAASRILEDNISRYPKSDFVHFMLGLCYASRYFLEGEKEEKLLNDARTHFKRARNLPPRFKMRMNVLISPRILAVYEDSIS